MRLSRDIHKSIFVSKFILGCLFFFTVVSPLSFISFVVNLIKNKSLGEKNYLILRERHRWRRSGEEIFMRLATNFIRRTKEIGFFTVPYFNDYCPLKAGLEMARRDTFMQIFILCN